MNVVVVGGGLAGLIAAYELTRAGQVVTILEANSRLGGQIWTERSQGFLIEHGAEGYAAGRVAGAQLCSNLDLTGRLVSQLKTNSRILRTGKLRPLPASMAAQLVGIQADRADFGQGIVSLRDGMGELLDALAAALPPRATVRLSTVAAQLAPRAGGWEIATSRGDVLSAEAVVLAVPPAAAASLVAPVFPDAAAILGSFRAVSSVSISVACPRSAVQDGLDGSGFISGAGAEDVGFRACSFASSKFGGRAPEDLVLLRAFFRPGRGFPLEAPDPRWIQLATEAIWPALGIRAQPVGAWVARWPRALPRYAPNHDACVGAVAQLLGAGAPLVLAGAGYRSAGIAGAIESAWAAVRSLPPATA